MIVAVTVRTRCSANSSGRLTLTSSRSSTSSCVLTVEAAELETCSRAGSLTRAPGTARSAPVDPGSRLRASRIAARSGFQIGEPVKRSGPERSARCHRSWFGQRGPRRRRDPPARESNSSRISLSARYRATRTGKLLDSVLDHRVARSRTRRSDRTSRARDSDTTGPQRHACAAATPTPAPRGEQRLLQPTETSGRPRSHHHPLRIQVPRPTNRGHCLVVSLDLVLPRNTCSPVRRRERVRRPCASPRPITIDTLPFVWLHQ